MIYLLAGFLLHAFHLAKCEIFINHETQQLEVTLMVFADDLEKAINHQRQNDHFDILRYSADDNTMEIIDDYLKNEFYLLIENQISIMRFLGYEIEENRCFLYLEQELPDEAYSLHCNLLTHLFPDQKNLVNIINEENESSYILNKSLKEIRIDP